MSVRGVVVQAVFGPYTIVDEAMFVERLRAVAAEYLPESWVDGVLLAVQGGKRGRVSRMWTNWLIRKAREGLFDDVVVGEVTPDSIRRQGAAFPRITSVEQLMRYLRVAPGLKRWFAQAVKDAGIEVFDAEGAARAAELYATGLRMLLKREGIEPNW